MQMKTKFGLTLVAFGVCVFAAWSWWTKTRKLIPVDMPVTLTAGGMVPLEFQLNYDGSYLIAIEADKSIPPGTLECLMDLRGYAEQCKDTPPAIGAEWILSSNGMEVGRGSSHELHSARIQTVAVARVIGEFQGKAGRRYKLLLTFTTDGKRLAEAHPHLKVGVASIAYTDLQSASVLVFSATFICLMFGTILLVIAYFAKRGEARVTQITNGSD
jgi:hypothetical protein